MGFVRVGLLLSVGVALGWGCTASNSPLAPVELAGASVGAGGTTSSGEGGGSEAGSGAGPASSSGNTGGAGGGSSAGGSGGEGVGGGTGGEGGAGGAPPVGFTDDNLAVRYFFDEAPTGMGPNEVLDYGPELLHAAIDYDDQKYATHASGNLGMSWSQPGGDGGAGAPLNGSDFADKLEGGVAFTLEAVVDVVDVSNFDDSRLVSVYSGSKVMLSVGVSESGEAHGKYNSDDQYYDGAEIAGKGRVVVHMVFDTSQVVPANRIRAYVDGQQYGNGSGSLPDLGDNLNTGAGQLVVTLGNGDNLTNESMQGFLLYGAIYFEALGDADITKHTQLLKQSDDS